MATVVSGDSNLFNTFCYGDPHPGTIQYLETKIANTLSTATDAARSFFQKGAELYEEFYSSDAMRKARNGIRMVRNMFAGDHIRELWEIVDFQQASPLMQRYVMAEPTIRKLYHEQRCHGYADSYVDQHPGMIGENHYDWRRVNEGMVQTVFNEEGKEDGWKVSFYMDDLPEGEVELTHDQQYDILRSWDRVHAFIAADEDPTSPEGGSL